MSTPAVTPPTPTAPAAASPAPGVLRTQEEEIAQAQSRASSGSLLGDFFMMLLKVIFGSFTDTTSEYSEIDRDNAAPADPNRGANARLAILAPEVQSKLRALAGRYTTLPPDISPFTVNATITSGLGARNIPVPGASHDHQGIDIVPGVVNAQSIQIHNTMPGVVVRSETQRDRNGRMAGFGNWVEVACIDGTRRRYGHLREPGAAVGTVLDQGDTLGIMGNTGTSEGAHLHYEWRDAGGTTLEPIIGNKTYARNDRSYIRSTVLASAGTGTPAPVAVAAVTPPHAASAHAAPAAPASVHATPAHAAPAQTTLAQQVQNLGLPRFDVADAVQGTKTAFANGMATIGSVFRG